MAEWKPVVGGRAVWRGPHLEVVVREFRQDGKALVVFTDEHADPPSGWVSAYQLTEHPDDARHRRLLDAARRVRVAEAASSRATEHPDWDGLVEAVREWQSALAALYAIVAEHDAAQEAGNG